MEIKNLEDLRAAFPDLMAQAETAAREDGRTSGITEERARIQGIEAIQNAIADQAMIASAKFGEKPLTAEQLAFQAMQAQAAIGAAVLRNIDADGADSNAEEVSSDPNGGPEAEEPSASVEDEVAEIVNLYNKMKNGGKK